MAINKVEFGDQTLIDLTSDTVTQQDVLNGKTFHSADGVVRSGTASIPSALDDLTDVSVTSPSNGQVLKYDASNNEWVNGNEGTVEIIPNPVDTPTAQLNSLGFYGTNVVTVLDNGLVSTSSAYAWASYRTALIIGTTYDLKLTDSFYPNDPIYSSFTWQGSTIVLTLGDRKQLTIEETRAGLTYFPGAWRQHYLDIKSQIQSTIYSVGNVTDVEVNGTSVVDANKIAKITSYKEITRAEYEALPDTKLTDNIAYFITDGSNAKVQGYPPLIYSLEEREVGVWKDGKPLYQITFELSTSMTIPNNSWQSIGVNPTNGEKIINCWGMTEDYSCAPFLGWMDGTIFKVQSARSNSGSYSVKWVTVLYTKTTDTAGLGIWNGQGGLAHHYSTNETVVGTWIDNKPLYEKTVFNNGSAITANAGAWTAICSESWVANVKSIINGNLTRQGTVGDVLVTPVEFTCNNGSIKINPFRNMTYQANGYFTVQYTKTTD